MSANDSPKHTDVFVSYEYDAFLSYAHEDAGTVAWLRGVLSTFWVPGKKRRRIFMDSKSLSAGGLNESLKRKLKESRYLIVCCSKSAVDSSWVDLEVREFLKNHPAESVLACLVGSATDDSRPLPISIKNIERQLDDALFTPDLRGAPEKLRGPASRTAKEAALSLLAPLVDLLSKDSILDRRKKFAIIAGVISVLVLILTLSAWAGWRWWLETPDGLRYQATMKVLAAVDSEAIDDPSLISAAAAFGRMGERKKLERFAGLTKDKDFKALALAAGYTSLPQPDCDSATRTLQNIDRVTARRWPDALLFTQSKCGGDWLSRVQPEQPDADDTLRWAKALARTGHLNAAQAIRDNPATPRKVVLPIEVAIAIASKRPLQFGPEDLNTWATDDDPHMLLRNVLELLKDLDRAERTRDVGSAALLDRAIQCTNALDIKQLDNWNLFQELAARLVAAGRAADALQLLQKEIQANRRGLPDWASGWAWRGLAYQRLGQGESSRQCFAEAERGGRAVVPANRTWNEWKEIELAYVMAGDWRSAFKAAEAPEDERVRILHRCHLIELWAERHGQG